MFHVVLLTVWLQVLTTRERAKNLCDDEYTESEFVVRSHAACPTNVGYTSVPDDRQQGLTWAKLYDMPAEAVSKTETSSVVASTCMKYTDMYTLERLK